jgi:hypothetical protein
MPSAGPGPVHHSLIGRLSGRVRHRAASKHIYRRRRPAPAVAAPRARVAHGGGDARLPRSNMVWPRRSQSPQSRRPGASAACLCFPLGIRARPRHARWNSRLLSNSSRSQAAGRPCLDPARSQAVVELGPSEIST